MGFKGKTHSDVLGVGTLSPGVVAMMSLLDRLNALVDETPPVEDKSLQRFGNKAFKEWHAKMADESDGLLKSVLPEVCFPKANKPAALWGLWWWLSPQGLSSHIE